MPRSPSQLDQIPVIEWTQEESFIHLSRMFGELCDDHPELMAPYVELLEVVNSQQQQHEIMWRGLRETFNKRYP